MQFSVVTVTYQNVEGLRRTSCSVLNQTHEHFEWVIVDGGSRDGTSALVDTIDDPRIRFVSGPDDGIFDAMNKGVDIASGHYVIFMNAGDMFARAGVLAEVSAAIGMDSPGLVYGDAWEAEPDGSSRHYKPARDPRHNRFVMFTHHQSIFYRSDLVKALKYDLTYQLSSDWVLTTRVLKTSVPVLRLESALSVFERGGISQSERLRGVANRELFRVYRHEQGFPLVGAACLWCIKVFTNKCRKWVPAVYDRVRYPRAS